MARTGVRPAISSPMNITRTTGTALFCLIAAAWAGFAAAGAQTVRVGIYQNSPKVAISEKGRPEGIFVDLLEAIAKAEGWTIEYVPGTWAEGLDRLTAAEIDLMPDVAITQAREARYAFHREPVLSDWFQVYTRHGSGIRSVLDLKGKRMSMLERSIQQEVFEKAFVGFDLGVTLVPLPDYAAAFAAVARGEVDAVIANRFYGAAHGPAQRLEDTAIIFNPTRLFFAAPRAGRPELLEAIDRQLKRLKQDPDSVYYRSLQRWTSEKVGLGMPAWANWAMIVALGLVILSLLWSVTLRRQVAARVREIAASNARLTDMNEQMRHIQLALRESERKYRALYENAGEAIFLMRNDRFIDCNARTLAIFGCQRDQIIGAPPYRFSPPFQPDGRPSEEKAREKINLALKEGFQFFDWEHCRLDQAPFSAEVSLTRLELDGESLLQAIVRDVTERKKAEEQIRRLHENLQRHAAELERRVAERTAELAVARDRAEESDRLKSAFLATMSHELRTPLNSIIGFTGILLMKLVGALNPEQEKQLVMVQDSARHLLELINDVLDISKIESGRIDLASEPVEMPLAIRKSAGKIKPLADKKNLSLEIAVGAGVGRVVADRRRVEQVLINLLSNAVKFTERGGVRIEARIADGGIETRVQDTGIGIRPEDMGALFKPFRQVDSGTTRQYEGTGLGLSICKRLVESMGGAIRVESELGRGSSFIFSLPLERKKS